MNKKKQIKPQPKYLYGIRRVNQFDEANNLDAQNIMHLITPVSHSKITSMVSKFQAFFGDIFFLNTKFESPNVINPLCEFLLSRQILFAKISIDHKPTAYKISLIDDNTRQIDKREQDKRRAVSNLLNQILNESDIKGEEDDLMHIKNREERMMRYLEEVNSKAESYKRDYLQLVTKNSREKNLIQCEPFLTYQIETLKQIEPLTSATQMAKWKDFVQRHKIFYSTQLIEKTKFRPTVYGIKISRPSSQSQPVLIRLSDFIELRYSNESYRGEALPMIKDIFLQLKKYNSQTSEFKQNIKVWSSHYPYLSPENVIIDQITLRPKLSYEPLIRDAFGIKNKPCSLECKLAHFPTPKEYNYFQSEEELNDKTNAILNDPLYGKQCMYLSELDEKAKAIINEEKANLYAIIQSICVDRFLLTSHFLSNNHLFGKPKMGLSYQQIKKHFKTKLKEKKLQIRQKSELLRDFIDVNDYNFNNKFNFTFAELDDYLSIEENDSLVENYKFTKMLHLFNLKYAFIREIIAILVNDKLFFKVSNVKKYIILYIVLGIQYLQEIKCYVSVENQKYGDIPKMKLYLEKNGKKVKQLKGVSSSLKSTYQKIEDYKNKPKDSKANFLNDDDFGKRLYEYVVQLYKQLEKQKGDLNSIIDFVQAEKKPLGYKQKVSEMVKRSIDGLNEQLSKFKLILLQFIYPEFEIRYASGPHRLPDDKNPLVVECYKQITRRFEIILFTFLTCSQSNYIIYETIVARMLKIEFSQEAQAPPAQPIFTKEAVDSEKNMLNAIDELIEFKKNMPKKFQYFNNSKDEKKYESQV